MYFFSLLLTLFTLEPGCWNFINFSPYAFVHTFALVNAVVPKPLLQPLHTSVLKIGLWSTPHLTSKSTHLFLLISVLLEI